MESTAGGEKMRERKFFGSIDDELCCVLWHYPVNRRARGVSNQITSAAARGPVFADRDPVGS
jgi:hypothetical protein